MLRFFIVITFIALVIPAMVNFCFYQDWISLRPSFLFETTLLVSLITGFIFYYLYRAGEGSFFVQFYLLTMSLKILAYLAYNLFMILEDRGGAIYNVLYFMAVYCLFTTAEIAFLFHKISGNPKP